MGIPGEQERNKKRRKMEGDRMKHWEGGMEERQKEEGEEEGARPKGTFPPQQESKRREPQVGC